MVLSRLLRIAFEDKTIESISLKVMSSDWDSELTESIRVTQMMPTLPRTSFVSPKRSAKPLLTLQRPLVDFLGSGMH